MWLTITYSVPKPKNKSLQTWPLETGYLYNYFLWFSLPDQKQLSWGTLFLMPLWYIQLHQTSKACTDSNFICLNWAFTNLTQVMTTGLPAGHHEVSCYKFLSWGHVLLFYKYTDLTETKLMRKSCSICACINIFVSSHSKQVFHISYGKRQL